MVLWRIEGTQLVKKEKSEDSIIIRCLKDSSKLRHVEKPSQAKVEVGYDSQDLEPVTVAVVEYNYNLTVYLGTIREKTMTFAKAKLGKLSNQLCKKKMLDSSLQLDKNDVLEI